MKRTIAISIVALVISTISGCIYYQYFYIPKKILQETLVLFETEVRNENYNELKKLVSKECAIYKYLPDPKLSEIMRKFHLGIVVVSANYTVESDRTKIHGVAKMKAKVDGENREFDNIFIQIENGIWKIRQFGFPDFIDY